MSLCKNHTFILSRNRCLLNVRVQEQGMQNKYCHILLMYQLLGAAHFSLWWFPLAKRQCSYLTSCLHLLILFWITVTLQKLQRCVWHLLPPLYHISLKQFQRLLHPKAECGSGMTFYFCYQFICHLFFNFFFTLSSGPLVP